MKWDYDLEHLELPALVYQRNSYDCGVFMLNFARRYGPQQDEM